MIRESVRRAIADPLVLGDQPAARWTVPADLPPIADLRAALTALRAELAPVKPKDARWCLGKVAKRFGITVDRYAWMAAHGKMPLDLWRKATLAVLQRDERPTVESFGAAVADLLARRRTDLARVEAMIAKTMAPKPVAQFVPEPPEVRLRTLLDAAERRGDTAAAARYERELAVLEGREPEAWAILVPSNGEANRDMPPAAIIASLPKNAAMLLRAAARFHRQRLPAYADQLERRADALAPRPVERDIGEPPPPSDVPEGHDYGEAA